jgi:hypothetical protein
MIVANLAFDSAAPDGVSKHIKITIAKYRQNKRAGQQRKNHLLPAKFFHI